MHFTVVDWGGYSWDQFKDTEHDTPKNRFAFRAGQLIRVSAYFAFTGLLLGVP